MIIKSLFYMTEDAWIESPFYCDYGYNILFGKGFYINHGCTLLDVGKITSGLEFAKPISVGNHVWFGANVTICPSVTMGDNVVIGAGGVVTKNRPSNTVRVGSPVKVIRENK
ncbi:DapH/DapD/GlmU-related protein [Marinomonas sp. 2405UD68-3]|uniref:DapH/DapD/GlmU-related protein n=1 Tax=Marinomonas sp. 2405UD68-3 TaxID=3391835 RepID=UPI0039C92B37